MDVASHIAALRREAGLLTGAANRAAPRAAVPMCPDWQVRDVLRHVGGVHRWARTNVAEARMGPMEDAEQEAIMRAPDDDGDLPGWVRDGAEALASALESAPADLECFSFLPAASPLAFWARRQAHETGIHRRDVEAAMGAVTPFPPELAADGIDELLSGFASRRGGRLRSDVPAQLGVVVTDAVGSWVVDIGSGGATARRDAAPAGGGPRCTVRGPASDLFLFLWNRTGGDGLEIDGDAALLDLWRESVRIRWT